MLFIKSDQPGGETQAVYLLGEDVEAMIDKSVDQRLRDHGYPVHERAELSKDMHFIRRKRQLVEHLTRQMATWLVHGLMVALGALTILGIKEYFRL